MYMCVCVYRPIHTHMCVCVPGVYFCMCIHTHIIWIVYICYLFAALVFTVCCFYLVFTVLNKI